MKTLFKQLFCLMLFVCVGLSATASCPRCHGKGRVKTFSSVSTYGVSNRKQQCPICREFVPFGDTHYDTCPQCGGSGNVSGSSSTGSSSDDKLQEQASDIMSYLDPADAMALEKLLHSLFMGKMIDKTCEACSGSGRCPICGGVQNMSMDATAADLCLACQGSGMCIRCGGTGSLGQEYVPWSGDERDQLVSNIKLYFDEAAKRRNQMEQMESGSSSDSDEAGGGLFSGSEGKKSASSGGRTWLLILGGIFLLLLGVFFGSRRKK